MDIFFLIDFWVEKILSVNKIECAFPILVNLCMIFFFYLLNYFYLLF